MSIADKLENKGKPQPKSGFKDFSQSANGNPGAQECAGGADMALAITSEVQGQANQMVAAANAANISIEHASDQMAAYFTEVLSGRALLNATLSKVHANLEQQGTVVIDAEVQPVTLDLPKIGGFQSTRQRFLSAFGGNNQKQSQLPAAFLKQPEGDNGECNG